MSPLKFHFPKLSGLTTYVATVVLSVALTFVALRVFPAHLVLSNLSKSTTAQSPQIQAAPSTAAQKAVPQNGLPNFVTGAIARVGASVVRIDTERTVSRNMPDPFFDDPFFQRFFGEGNFPQLPRTYRQYGEGSGFVTNANGVILTNAHVVSGADRVKVTLKDGRTFPGMVRGIDQPSDLAVVKIDGENLPVAPIGNSSQVQVGDWAIAVGNPLGLDNTVTLGIISTLKRSSATVGLADKRLDFIQTDAAINPGNSGGPLLNDRGEVIGINTAIRANAQGIGFAIPIDRAKAIQERLANGEKIPHPYLGIRLITLTPDLAKQFNQEANLPVTLPEISGVLVAQLEARSPAAIAKLQVGDVITAIDRQPMTNAEQLQEKVANSQIGQALSFTVHRGQQTEQLSVRPAELPDTDQ
jgi:S1-C subfamily serine protease